LAAAGCRGDSFTTVDLFGRAAYPPGYGGGLGEVAPIANAPFQVRDLSRSAESGLIGTGLTDENGRYFATVPVTPAVSVTVLGEVRIAGLIDSRHGSVEKSFDGVTAIACQAGTAAVDDGSIDAVDLDQQRIANLEEAAAVVIQESPIDYTNADGSRAAAAKRVRELTNDGEHPIGG
jgi:hypothetical protein